MTWIKPTSRYRLNKFVSEQSLSHIKYAADVTMSDKPKIMSELDKMLRNNSITIIILEHHTPRGIL
jgi:hypothetical protein